MSNLIEQTVEIPIVNPDTDAKSRSFVFMGKVDLVEGHTVTDYKNSSNIARYIHTMTLSFQPELYALAVRHQFSRQLTDMEYRLVQRPALKFTPKDAEPSYAILKEGQDRAVKANLPSMKAALDFMEEKRKAASYGVESHAYYAEDRTKPAVTRDGYEQRCYEQIVGDPERIMSHPLHLNEGRMRQAQGYLWDCSKRVLENRRTGRWIHNPQACYDWNKTCPFIRLCDAMAAGADCDWIADEEFYEVDNQHPELGDAANLRLDVLTYSSCSDLSRCEMLYRWKYERCLRKGQEDSEPLWVGSAMHIGMAAFAENGLEAALTAVDEWSEANPVLGDDVRKADEQTAKARAMCRAAAEKWG